MKTELVLPVTPPGFQVSHGINVETINIHTLGDVAVAGYGTLPTFKIDCMFPAKDYPFNQPGADTQYPYNYIRKLQRWLEGGTVLRYIVSDTPVNMPVILADIEYGEQDGTGDVYAAIEMRKYRELSVVQVENTGNDTRTNTAAPDTADTYIVKSGDTLSAICRKYYGDASLYPGLASYNGIKNPHLIYPGNVIKLPDKSLL